MCLRQLEVLTRSNKVYRNTMPRLFNVVRCGYCAECQQNIRNEYMYRTYYETKDTFNKGGYIIFDTLTYNEDIVPWTKQIVKNEFDIDIPNELNFRCFNYKDVTNFHKRLRRNLERLYGDDIELKYILASEYGTAIGATHRPHYHVIYFIKDSRVDPVLFSKLVRKNWSLGITDGVDDKGITYFKNQRLFYNSVDGVNNAVGYISKYIAKDSSYSRLVRVKEKEIEKYLDKFDKSFKESYQGKLRLLALRRGINQFKKCSKGFGETAFDYMDLERIFEDGKVIRPDSYKIKTAIQLPMYYYRKLFQFYDKDEKIWKYNDSGKLLKRKSIERKIRRLADVYETRLLNKNDDNISDLQSKSRKELLSYGKKQNIVDDICKMLGKRTLYDYAKYQVIYARRLFNDNDTISGINYFLEHMFDENQPTVQINFRGDTREHYGIPYVINDGCEINASDYVKYNCVDEFTLPQFYDFDKISMLFKKLSADESIRKQAAFDKKQALMKKYKKSSCVV